LMKEWGVGSALLHGGASSAYGFGDYPGNSGWAVTLSNPAPPYEVVEKIHLKDQALGGSGIKQGRHIIDPRKGAPVEHRRASWILSESASRSDALSTACMVMAREEIQALVAGSGELRALIIDESSREVLRFGRWDEA